LKNRKFDKKAPHNSCLERATIVRAQGASEDKNYEEKLTLSKNDFSSSFGISIPYFRYSFSYLRKKREKVNFLEYVNKNRGLEYL